MTSHQNSESKWYIPAQFVSSLVIGGIGAITFVIHLLHLFQELDDLVALVVGVLPPMTISIALIGGGYWIRQSTLNEEYHVRIIGWTIIGIVGFGGIGASTIIYQWSHGTPQTDVPFMIMNWIVTGAFGGFLIGIYNARQRELAEALRQERDEVAAREEHLTREVERLERFASITSHDLRNPLNVAKGRLELVRETNESENLDAVASALDRMDAIIDDMLTMAREGHVVSEDDQELVSLADCAEMCWDSVATADATLK
ncbi:MAG: sensor histidine kinase, partial [Halobacteriaceae archaeon]